MIGVMRDEFGLPDIVHAFDSRPTVILPSLMLVKRCQVPLVMDWADWWGRGGTIESRETSRLTRFVVRAPETWFEEAFRSRADKTTVISTGLAARAERLGIPPASITVLPQGCDTSILPKGVAEARRRLGFSEDDPVIGYEGTLLREDASLLVQSFLSLRMAQPRLRLLLIGDPRIQLPDLPGLLRTGFVPRDQLSDYLAACDFFLLPLSDTVANRGRWPSKLNDYFSAGRPTVATPIGDVQTVFARSSVGLLGRVEDGSLLAACLALLVDPEARARMGSNARRLAETELSWSTICDRLVSVYREALSSPHFSKSLR
jgi:glycosyltransferase involved in cell wall biosynthesis